MAPIKSSATGELTLSVNESKARFFDREMTSHLDQKKRSALARFGAYCMRTARRSIRDIRRKKVSELGPRQRAAYEANKGHFGSHSARRKLPLAHSKPGQPPRSISGLLRKFIFFVYDPNADSVVIGPALLDRPTGAPHILEYGGNTLATFFRKRNGKWNKYTRNVTIAKRPYMAPAYDKTVPKMKLFWQ